MRNEIAVAATFARDSYQKFVFPHPKIVIPLQKFPPNFPILEVEIEIFGVIFEDLI